MGLRFTPGIAEQGKGTGDFKSTVVCTCECGSTEFRVFQIVGQAHPHLSCVKCEATYCPNGSGCEGVIH